LRCRDTPLASKKSKPSNIPCPTNP
jgi:hypothetical protein